MIELPEAANLAGQITAAVRGKRIASVTAGHTPHKLAWYYGEPSRYPELLAGKIAGGAIPVGGLVQLDADDMRILFGEGVTIRFHAERQPRPARHQYLMEFEDGSALSAAIQLYGGVGAFADGTLENPYYLSALKKPSPLSNLFDLDYFTRITGSVECAKLSLKALLATNQRIPGLGNGILQDILFNAGMHPRKKTGTLADTEMEGLFTVLKTTISRMASQGGRDTELDLFGARGGYKTLFCKDTAGKPCPACGKPILKEAYLGGAVYFCPGCQKL